MAAVAIDEADIARNNPDFAKRNPGLRTVERGERPPAEGAERSAKAQKGTRTPTPKYGASERTRAAANATRTGFRAVRGVGNAAGRVRGGMPTGGFNLAGIIVFGAGVGILIYLFKHPQVIPNLAGMFIGLMHDVLNLVGSG